MLVEPQEEGNIGAAARAMANMGLDELVLVRPGAAIGRTARAFAVGADHVLDRARVASEFEEALAPYQRIVGTTSARGRHLPLAAIPPRQLAGRLLSYADSSCAVVFGPEASGLDNEQLARCGLLVRVPCADEQPTLNLAQAVLLIAYELLLARADTGEAAVPRPATATAEEIDELFRQLLPVLSRVGFARDDTFQSVLRDLRRLAARAGPTPREIRILRGICRRTRHALADRD